MRISDLIKKFPDEKDLKAPSRPYFNHSIEFKNIFTPTERAEMLDTAGLNMFFFPSEMITGCDLLSDSGTTSMTNEQWAALHLGDEAYGSNRGYFLVMKQIRETFGKSSSMTLTQAGQMPIFFTREDQPKMLFLPW